MKRMQGTVKVKYCPKGHLMVYKKGDYECVACKNLRNDKDVQSTLGVVEKEEEK